jgi:predicted CXXCH cytochrome family protein
MTADYGEPAAVEASSSGAAPSPARLLWKAGRIGLSVLAIACLAITAWIIYRPSPPAPAPEEDLAGLTFPPDPRLSYKGPFRNIHPDVEHVGDGKCVDCHQEIARKYSRHPMGRSLAPITQVADHPPDDRAHHNPFKAFDVLYRVDRQGGRVYHRMTSLDDAGKPIYDFAHEVAFVLGSGMRGHSYLSVREGYVFQTPVSWFTEKQIWDLSPGFPPWARAGRLVPGMCLYCHTNHVEPIETTRNRYREPVFRGHAIGCERCHGPGALHIQTVKKDDIVNPKRLEPALREAVCQQCHLQGATRVLRRGRKLNDYRPGMPLEEFLTVHVRGPGKGADNKAVGHVEQMYQSLCFQRSVAKNKMGCITCHDPHEAVAPQRRVAYYRAKCLQCHAERPCSLAEEARQKQSAEDSCIACHMPRSATSDIVHIAGSDHRIVRKSGEEPTNRRGNRPLPDVPLLDFHRGAPDLNDQGQGRDLGVALYQLALGGMPLTGGDG